MDLESLSRKELQALAKQHGIKANISNSAIIEQLSAVLATESAATEEVASMPTVEETSVECTQIVENFAVVLEPEQMTEVVEVLPLLTSPPMSIIISDLPDEPGPFSSYEEKKAEKSEEVCEILEDAKVGDVIEVCHDDIWKEATVKRINKVSYRVTLNESGREITVKMTEIRAIRLNENLESVELEIAEVADIEFAAKEIEQSTSMEMEESDYENNQDIHDDSITIPDEELIAGLMENEDEPDEEELEIEVQETTESSLYCSEYKNVCNKRKFSINLDKTPKKLSRTSDLPAWNSTTKADPFKFEIGTAPNSTKKTPGSSRKTLILTPNRSRSSMAPKTNVTQRLRLEALQKKNALVPTNVRIINLI
jgi:sRNA-binding protein